MQRIFLSPPHLDEWERELLLQAFNSNRIITLGPQVNAFEEEMSEKIGVANAGAPEFMGSPSKAEHSNSTTKEYQT